MLFLFYRISGPGADFACSNAQQHYRIVINEAYDTASEQLRVRFNESTPALSSYLLLSSCLQRCQVSDDETELIIELRKYREINLSDLQSELQVLRRKWNTTLPLSLGRATDFLRECSPEFRSLFPNFEALLRLLLVRPASSVECERSFGALRRLKTWLRSSMTQIRLNSVAIIHVHQSVCDKLDMGELMNTFISCNLWRLSTFTQH